MPSPDELIQLERAAWQALSTSGEAATAFYDEVLADEVLVLMPGGMVIDDRGQIVESMSGAPWDTFELADERVLALGDDAAVVTYRVSASRGEMDYAALLASTYVHQPDGWRLALHQQTPV